MQQAEELLQKHWGFAQFRPLQREIIEAAAAGKDVVALLRTGGGKSVCYQIPGLMRKGLCLVISPLLALMKDQVEGLRSRGIRAHAVNSSMHFREMEVVLDNCRVGAVDFLYISPERLLVPNFQQRLERLQVGLIAVDEAHCISEWGYDFRPSYLKIAEVRALLPGVPVMALTASATPKVVEDIKTKLEMQKPAFFQASFARTNLNYAVRMHEDKLGLLLRMLQKINGTGIVYAGTRRKCRMVADLLTARGVRAEPYHAGMTLKERSTAQDSWMSGKLRLVVATNAFGMGIDKADVRFVVHWDPPASPEAYYQEAGRAGRDGRKSWALLLLNPGDLGELEQKVTGSFPELEQVRRIYQHLCDHLQLAIGAGLGETFPFEISRFSEKYKLPAMQVLNGLKILSDSGFLYLSDAFYRPGKLRFTMAYNDLYNYEIAHPATAPFVQLLLRSYAGLFDEFVHINEIELAYRSKLPREKVVQWLFHLQKQGVVNYQPPSDLPLITFVAARADATRMRLDKAAYDARKERALDKMKAINHYAENNTYCRSQFLQRYFGELNTLPCGHCDVCLEKKRSHKPLAVETITAVLKEEPATLEHLLLKIRQPEDETLFTIRWLLDEGKIRWHDTSRLAMVNA